MNDRKNKMNPEVEIPIDPYEGLPPRLTAMLEKAVLGASWERALVVLDGLQMVLDQLGTDVSQGAADSATKGAVPSSILNEFGKAVRRASPTDLTVLVECLRDLLSDWNALLVDDEKLVGHLCLQHGMAWQVDNIVMRNDHLLDDTIAAEMRNRHWEYHRPHTGASDDGDRGPLI